MPYTSKRLTHTHHHKYPELGLASLGATFQSLKETHIMTPLANFAHLIVNKNKKLLLFKCYEKFTF